MISRLTICVLWTLFALAFADAGIADNEVPKIGVLMRVAANWPGEQAFLEGLNQRGYVVGKNILIEWRRTSGGLADLRPLATELVARKVDVIVAFSTPAAVAALESTNTIPVVFAAAADPLATGLATSLAQPGGNATGVSIQGTEVAVKRLDLLHQLAAHARRCVYLVNLANPSAPPQLKPLRQAATTMGMKLDVVDVHTAEEVHRALHSIPWRSIGGIVIGGDTIQLQEAEEIARAVQIARVPAVFPYREYHRYGAVLSYGPNLQQVYERTAYYVDRILKGARPTELPVEQWSKFELILDLRIAKETDVKVPQELVLRADEVIR